ncbi:MAG: ABC transporter substrate-binding protein [Dehalococcoidia bacterium]
MTQDSYWSRFSRRNSAMRAAIGGGDRHLSRRRFLGGAVAVTSAGLIAACGGGGRTETPAAGVAITPGAGPAAKPTNVPKGGSLTIAQVGTDAKSFHPFQTTDANSSAFQAYIYGGGSLTDRDPFTLDLIPGAAEKWTMSEDKKTITFTLRDIKWSDGTPMTTADYVWTFDQVRKPENKYPYLQNLDEIVSYTALDAKTLQVVVKEPLAVAVETADAVNPLPKHVWEKYDWGDSTKNPEINSPTVGNGPWKLKEWKRDSFATFVANDLYWEGRPNLDSITVRNFGKNALAYQALKAGDIDVSGFDPADYEEAKKLSNVNVYEYYLARGSWTYLGFNLRRPALKDLNVRRAVAYATDRKGIIDGVRFGLGRPTYSAFPPSSWVYNDKVEKYDFSVEKAKEHFTKAGYTLDSRKRLVKDGQQLTFKLLYNTPSVVAEGVAAVLKQQLEELGIAVDAQGLEFQAYLEIIKKEPFDYDLFFLAWNSTLEPHFAYQIWSERSIPQLNAGAYINKDVEKLFDQGSKEFDREKRKQIYGQIQKIIADELPYVFLYESLGFTGVSKRVGGITPTGLGIAYNLHEWYVTK